MKSPPITLRYFDIAGRAEITRLLLHYADVPFIDRRIPHKLFPHLKPRLNLPLGSLPTLEVGNETFGETLAIARYAATLSRLYPSDDHITACASETVAARINEMMIALFCVLYMKETCPTKNKKKLHAVRRMVTSSLMQMEMQAASRAAFFARRTWIDVYLFDLVMNVLLPFHATLAIPFNQYPKLAAIVGAVRHAPELASYLSKQNTTKL
ncbi:Aste57867_14646 [Aphanomyces stellatus]|uniref:Aste57867_14646 protein n=1 Tax=Aphanomyces stellatus TaxID=120398 RepID=A0A485L174_9STRA|nr:hypothetical protein As57867_014591 [Aphanomyces stellatus]VFT91465.1 Aste57867_14646 [Aphanomyces stellatus]